MILWIILFLLVIAISFLLAFWSMKDYQEIPQKSSAEYGLFLIRHTAGLTPHILDSMYSFILKEGLIISIERLFKGRQAALAVFGPKKILEQFIPQLNLLELEDYTLNLNTRDIFIWEMGVKPAHNLNLAHLNHIFKDLPQLSEEEQFFWQVVLAAKKGDETFKTQIRAAIYSRQAERRRELAPFLQNLGLGELVKVPKPFSQEQMMNAYKLRGFSRDSKGPALRSEELTHLLKV